MKSNKKSNKKFKFFPEINKFLNDDAMNFLLIT